MIQKTYKLSSIDEISGIASELKETALYKSASCKLLLAWAQLWEEDSFSAFRQEILGHFSDFTIIGSNSHSHADILNNRIDGSGDEKGCFLTFVFFEKAGVSLHGITTGYREESRQGRELKELIMNTEDTKAVFLVPPDYLSSTEDVLAELKELKGIPIFGIKTSLHAGYSTFGREPGGEVISGRLLTLLFHGKALSIRAHYNLGWTPVGKTMTVTKEENPFFVDEIDGKKATSVYNKYLGLRDDQIIPQNLSEFPLIIDRDGVKISRIGITGPKEGQMIFGAPVYLNDRISLSYGNPDDLFTEIAADIDEIVAFEAQAGLLIVCSNRVMLLKERELDEIELYRKQIKEAAAVYGYGELFYLDGRGGELNSALVSVSFKESEELPAAANIEDSAKTSGIAANTEASGITANTGESAEPSGMPANGGFPEELIVPFHDRLSRMFKEMSGDLIAALTEAEDANRAKSVFYSAVSHEIRTPLNAILGMNEMILKESHNEEISKYAANIKSSGKLLLQLINDILDTGKIDAGKMEIVPVDYNVRSTMDELADMISFSAKEKGLEFLYRIDGELPEILHGDEKRIRQCIINLLNNAVKYTESGRVVFGVASTVTDKDHVRLKVRVADSGIGIKPEDIEKLSIPFERVDRSKNYKVEGTGLGLNIVNNLLALMDSRLEIRSVYGRGSEFSFVIEQEISGAKDTDQKSGAAAAKEEGWGNLRTRGASILAVDDTPLNLELVNAFLKDSLIDIDTAQDGYGATDMAAKKKYDIIFLDMRMPGMDGVETFRKIKDNKEGVNADTPVILLTALEGVDVRSRFAKEGFSDFMSKPFTPEMLESLIRKHLPEGKLI